MPHRDPDDFDGHDCTRVYMAGRLREAKRVERTLDDQGIDYFVQVEVFRKMLLGVIPRDYHGAAFYVRVADAEASRRILSEASLKTGILEDEEPVE
jgi:hypothetical protein